MNSNRIGRRTNFFWHPVLPHKCGVPLGYGTPHLCGSEEFCRAPKRILVVDDEPGVTRSLKLNLEATAGYEVRTENDSALAIDAARDFHPQLILLDVLMPHLDGCDVSARIHADPELKDTPIVFLTSLASNEWTGGHAVVAGSTVYLAKPVDTGELIKCIEQALLPKLQPRRHALSFHR